jgi:hypothetical protein
VHPRPFSDVRSKVIDHRTNCTPKLSLRWQILRRVSRVPFSPNECDQHTLIVAPGKGAWRLSYAVTIYSARQLDRPGFRYTPGVLYEDVYRKGGNAALREAQRFLMGESAVQESLQRIATKLDQLGIAYAVAGGMALVGHGYNRTTVDVDILVTAESLKRIHDSLEGLGYVAPFAGSKNLRDTISNVRIEFLVSGGFPGDGKPKPVAFPEPRSASTVIDGVHYLALPRLIELKLASGMTGGVARMKDFADVVELCKLLSLDESFGEQLDPYVREEYLKIVHGLRDNPDPHA